MNRPIAIVLLVAGLILLVLGINASNAFASETSEFFTGSPTDEAMWMMLGGGVLAVVGFFGLKRKSAAQPRG